MRVLVTTNIYPTNSTPFTGTFVAEQVQSLRSLVDVEVVAKQRGTARGYVPFLAATLIALAKYKYDVVHAHYGFHSGLIPACFGDAPLVTTFHGSDALREPSRSILHKKMQRLVVSRSARIVAVSGQIRRELIEVLGADEGKVAQIPCGVDTTLFRKRAFRGVRKSVGLERSRKVVLFVGRLTKGKGVDLLQGMAAKLPNTTFVFLGEGPCCWQEPNCIFLGGVSRQQVADWMNEADLLVLPSLSEGTPICVLEALSSETPVVCTRVGACQELVEEGKTGLTVERHNRAQLTDAIHAALECRNWNGHAGRALVEREYSLNAVAQRLTALYRSMLQLD